MHLTISYSLSNSDYGVAEAPAGPSPTAEEMLIITIVAMPRPVTAYVISNIGLVGPDIYKIGVTPSSLDPLDRNSWN